MCEAHRRSRRELRLEQIAIWGQAASQVDASPVPFTRKRSLFEAVRDPVWSHRLRIQHDNVHHHTSSHAYNNERARKVLGESSRDNQKNTQIDISNAGNASSSPLTSNMFNGSAHVASNENHHVVYGKQKTSSMEKNAGAALTSTNACLDARTNGAIPAAIATAPACSSTSHTDVSLDIAIKAGKAQVEAESRAKSFFEQRQSEHERDVVQNKRASIRLLGRYSRSGSARLPLFRSRAMAKSASETEPDFK